MMLYLFFFNDTATTEIYTLSLHDALPISLIGGVLGLVVGVFFAAIVSRPLADEGFVLSFPVGTLLILLVLAALAGVLAAIAPARRASRLRSEEHTSELQSRQYLVCRLLLEKKKTFTRMHDGIYMVR